MNTLKEMRQRGINCSTLMTRYYGVVNQDVMLNFRLQSAPPDIFTAAPGDMRTAWHPISDYTAAARLAGRPSTKRVGAILQETGALRASMGKVREITPFSMTYGTPSAISAAHHFGVTIKPKHGQFLALPYPGVRGRPRDYEDAFFIGGSLYRKKDGELEPLFFLKKQVKLPARPHMTVTKSTIDRMAQMAGDYFLKNLGMKD
jgi:phage gpG-like protein